MVGGYDTGEGAGGGDEEGFEGQGEVVHEAVTARGETDASEADAEAQETPDAAAFEGRVVVLAFLFFGEDLHGEGVRAWWRWLVEDGMTEKLELLRNKVCSCKVERLLSVFAVNAAIVCCFSQAANIVDSKELEVNVVSEASARTRSQCKLEAQLGLPLKRTR